MMMSMKEMEPVHVFDPIELPKKQPLALCFDHSGCKLSHINLKEILDKTMELYPKAPREVAAVPAQECNDGHTVDQCG